MQPQGSKSLDDGRLIDDEAFLITLSLTLSNLLQQLRDKCFAMDSTRSEQIMQGKQILLKTKRRDIELLEKEFIIWPLHKDLHYSLIIICHLSSSTKQRCILHFDSYKGHRQNEFEAPVRNFLASSIEQLQPGSDIDVSTTALPWISVQKLPAQPEGSVDCGFFACCNLAAFLATYHHIGNHLDATNLDIEGAYKVGQPATIRKGLRQALLMHNSDAIRDLLLKLWPSEAPKCSPNLDIKAPEKPVSIHMKAEKCGPPVRPDPSKAMSNSFPEPSSSLGLGLGTLLDILKKPAQKNAVHFKAVAKTAELVTADKAQEEKSPQHKPTLHDNFQPFKVEPTLLKKDRKVQPECMMPPSKAAYPLLKGKSTLSKGTLSKGKRKAQVSPKLRRLQAVAPKPVSTDAEINLFHELRQKLLADSLDSKELFSKMATAFNEAASAQAKQVQSHHEGLPKEELLHLKSSQLLQQYEKSLQQNLAARNSLAEIIDAHQKGGEVYEKNVGQSFLSREALNENAAQLGYSEKAINRLEALGRYKRKRKLRHEKAGLKDKGVVEVYFDKCKIKCVMEPPNKRGGKGTAKKRIQDTEVT